MTDRQLAYLSYFTAAVGLYLFKFAQYALDLTPDRRKISVIPPDGLEKRSACQPKGLRLAKHQNVMVAFVYYIFESPAETFLGTIGWVWLGGAVLIDNVTVPFLSAIAMPKHIAAQFMMGLVNESIGPWTVGKIVDFVKSKFTA